MRNDLQVKVTCITNDKKDELHFDYYDKEGTIVGTVVVDENGKLGWMIWDINSQFNILSSVSYIFGRKVENSIEYMEEAKTYDPIRWERAQSFINNTGLLVNYKQDIRINGTLKDGVGKRNSTRR